MSASITSNYNTMMADLSANGTSADTIKGDVKQFQSALQSSGGNQDLKAAAANITNSLDNGTFSQQGSQGALEGAATKDKLTNVNTPQIDGNAGQAHQSAGSYNGAQVGSKDANLNILKDEIAAHPSDLAQVRNNAQALSKEAANSGNTRLANAASNIAKSTSDGTYSADKSSKALDMSNMTDTAFNVVKSLAK